MNKRILLLGLLAALPASRSYGSIMTYTDQVSFLNLVAPGYYLETFDGLNGLKNLGNDLYFSSNGYSYWAHAFGGYSYGNGQFYGGYLNYGDDLVLMASQQGTTFTFDFLNGNITAVGGTFFMQNNDQHVTDGTMIITLQDGSQITFYEGTPFYGFTSQTPITEITVDSNRMSAMDNLYVGSFVSAVPEPGSAALLAAGLGLILLGRFRRWNLPAPKRRLLFHIPWLVLCLVTLTVLPAIGRASTIFNTLSTGAIPATIPFHSGWGFASGALMAAQFTPASSVQLAELDVAIGFGGVVTPVDGNIVLKLFNDSNGVPGSQIGSYAWTFIAPPKPPLGGDMPVTRIAVTGVTLTGGQPYWLVALPGDAQTVAAWLVNDLIPSAQGLHAINYGSAWQVLNPPANYFTPAFAVIASDAPEPGSLALLSFGLALGGIAGWRKVLRLIRL